MNKRFFSLLVCILLFEMANGQVHTFSSFEIENSLDFSSSFQHVFETKYSFHVVSNGFELSAGCGYMSRGFSPIIIDDPEKVIINYPYVQEYNFVTEVSIKNVFANLRKIRKFIYPFIGLTMEIPFPLHTTHAYQIILPDVGVYDCVEQFDWTGGFIDLGADFLINGLPRIRVSSSFDLIHLGDQYGFVKSGDIDSQEYKYEATLRRPFLFKIKIGVIIPHGR